MQAGLKRPVHFCNHSSRPRQLKDTGLDASNTAIADHKQRKGRLCRKDQADEQDDGEGGEEAEGRQPNLGNSKVVIALAEEIHRLAACLDINEHEHQLRNPHSELRTCCTCPSTPPKEDHSDGQDQLANGTTITSHPSLQMYRDQLLTIPS
ncbi:hypothetical protein MJO28_008008, partial [Puccinia striiformis f. sp. tritici]